MAYQFWTNKQLKFLIDSAATLNVSEISSQINRTPNAIYRKAAELGIKLIHVHNNERWSDEHLALLNTHTAAQVAKLTGRTYNAVWTKLNRKLAA